MIWVIKRNNDNKNKIKRIEPIFCHFTFYEISINKDNKKKKNVGNVSIETTKVKGLILKSVEERRDLKERLKLASIALFLVHFTSQIIKVDTI